MYRVASLVQEGLPLPFMTYLSLIRSSLSLQPYLSSISPSTYPLFPRPLNLNLSPPPPPSPPQLILQVGLICRCYRANSALLIIYQTNNNDPKDWCVQKTRLFLLPKGLGMPGGKRGKMGNTKIKTYNHI